MVCTLLSQFNLSGCDIKLLLEQGHQYNRLYTDGWD